jgi:hypothetical protein
MSIKLTDEGKGGNNVQQPSQKKCHVSQKGGGCNDVHGAATKSEEVPRQSESKVYEVPSKK